MDCFEPNANDTTKPLFALAVKEYEEWLKTQPALVQSWLNGMKFKAKKGNHSAFPLDGTDGETAIGFVLIVEDEKDIWSWGAAAKSLPEGRYEVQSAFASETAANHACLGWALGCYQFSRYKRRTDPIRELVWPKEARKDIVLALADGIALTRDLINTPASDMGPEELAAATRETAERFGAVYSEVVGDALLSENFPMIHAVGRASDRPPRLVELTWGDASHPKVTLVGKGVCFDTGGLDLKPSQYMLTMKKDMGGAANALGLAHIIMATGLKVRLRLLISAVENSVSGNAFRPLDVLESRQGITVEVGNTDAEGRLVLGDALTLAGEETPDMILDFATLTGAARVALGTDMPAFFCNQDELAESLEQSSKTAGDPIWRLPLHSPYESMLDSKVADTNNVSSGGYAGAITAALFLQKFVPTDVPWAHFDMMAWNTSSKAGKPEGGEAQSIRGIYHMLQGKYG